MGSAVELNQFLTKVEKRAYFMALQEVKNGEDALDIVQDVMMSLATKYAARPAEQWAPLFYRMLRNRTMDYHRKGAVRRRWFGWLDRAERDAHEAIERAPAPAMAEPDQEHLRDEFTDELQQALGALPDRQRQAFMLRSWEGLDVKETAAAMGCSTGSVKTHYSRAVRSLRQRLQESYGEG